MRTCGKRNREQTQNRAIDLTEHQLRRVAIKMITLLNQARGIRERIRMISAFMTTAAWQPLPPRENDVKLLFREQTTINVKTGEVYPA